MLTAEIIKIIIIRTKLYKMIIIFCEERIRKAKSWKVLISF